MGVVEGRLFPGAIRPGPPRHPDVTLSGEGWEHTGEWRRKAGDHCQAEAWMRNPNESGIAVVVVDASICYRSRR